MKKYETPSIEKLEFDYTDVVASSNWEDSVTLTQASGCEGSPIVNNSGWTEKPNSGCEHLKSTTEQNWKHCHA